MCQQIIEFCNGSARPLMYLGAALSTALAVIIGYTTCTSYALYSQIDPVIAESKSIGYYLQLTTAIYLLLMTLVSIYAGYSEQKYSIRALAVFSTVNCVLAIAATLMVPAAHELTSSFVPTLERAAEKYDFTEALNATLVADKRTLDQPERLNDSSARVLDSKVSPAKQERELTRHNATQIWDSLQARGCCGLKNANSTWSHDKIPKSCCRPESVVKTNDEFRCNSTDSDHAQGCLELIGQTSVTLSIVLILIALVNLYLAVISAISTYRTIHYNEASQSAYT